MQFHGRGAILGCSAGFFYALGAFAVKLLSSSVNPICLTLVKEIFAGTISLILIIINRDKFRLKTNKKDFAIHVLHALYSFNMIALYYSFQVLPLGDVITIYSTSYVFVSLLNCVIYRKVCNLLEIFMIFVTIVGVILCVQPSFIFTSLNIKHHGNLFLYLLPLISSSGTAVTCIISAHFRELKVYTICLMKSCPCVFIYFAYIELFDACSIPKSQMDFILLATVGLSSVAALYLSVLSSKLADPFFTSVGLTFEIIVAFVFDAFAFNLYPNILSIVAAILISFIIILPTIIRFYIK
ncbi:Uncharacterised protein at_DN2469 [Pycnogonum litorale]